MANILQRRVNEPLKFIEAVELTQKKQGILPSTTMQQSHQNQFFCWSHCSADDMIEIVYVDH